MSRWCPSRARSLRRLVEAERPGPLEFLQVLERVERSLVATGRAEEYSRSGLRVVDEAGASSSAATRHANARVTGSSTRA
jgi:hypothetical protein